MKAPLQNYPSLKKNLLALNLKNNTSELGQGALEYLILIGGVILVSIVVISFLLFTSADLNNSTNDTSEWYSNLINNTRGNIEEETVCELPQIECTENCMLPVCTVNSECDDSNPNTIDTCNNPGECIASCANEELVSCANNDGVCPSTCYVGNDNDCSSLRELADSKGIWFGAMLAHPLHETEPKYAEVLTREFNITPPGAAFLFKYIQPTEGAFNFSEADAITEYASDNNLKIYANHLAWHYKAILSDFILDGDSETPEELEAILENHVKTTVSHFKNSYPGDIVVWNAANEVISACPEFTGDFESGFTTNTFILRGETECAEDEADGEPVNIWISVPDYVKKTFDWANETDPSVKLYYNDYGIEGGAYSNPTQHWWSELKYQQTILMLEDLLARGTPVDGLGFQMHTTLELAPTKEDLKQKFSQLNSMGLRVAITEMEIGINTEGGITEQELEQQAQIYKNIVEACLESNNCDGVISWCFTDKYAWLPSIMPNYDSPCIFDSEYNPKPAYFAIKEALT